MPNDLNQCNFIGRLGKDPDLRYTANGSAVASFSVAVAEKYKEKEHTEWVRVVAFNALAEICGKYLVKGQQIFISGRLQSRKWQDQGGQDRYTTEIVASEMQMLGKKEKPAESRSEGFRKPKDEPQKSTDDGWTDDDLPF